VVILSVPAGAPVVGEEVGWLLGWFVHAPNGAMVAVRTATATAAPFFIGEAYPN
jgi:hypothetical protein